MRYTLLLFCSFFSLTLSSQINPQVDSLEQQLDSLSGLKKAQLYLRLGAMTSLTEKERSEKFIKSGLDYLETIDTLTEVNKLDFISRFAAYQNWGSFENKDFIAAFKGSFYLDSLAAKLLAIEADYHGNRFHADASTLRGAIFTEQKHFAKAKYEFSQSLDYYKKLNDTLRLGWGYQNLAILNRDLENYEKSEALFLKAEGMFESVNNQYNVFNNRRTMGKMYFLWGKPEKSEEVLRKAFEFAKDKKMDFIFHVKGDLAKALFALGKEEEGEQMIKEASALLDEIDSPKAKKENLEVLAYVLEKNGETEKALQIQKQIKDLENKMTELSFSEELVNLQSEYENSLHTNQEDSKTNYWWLLLPICLAGLFFMFRKKEQTLPSPEQESQKNTLEISIKDESEKVEYEDPFLENFISKVTAQLSNENLTVESLAEEMGMSRVQLFKKVKAATGDSPSSIIRKTRLERAAQILRKKGDLNISDVAYQVGFSNPKSFSRAFKDQFGVAPSDFS